MIAMHSPTRGDYALPGGAIIYKTRLVCRWVYRTVWGWQRLALASEVYCWTGQTKNVAALPSDVHNQCRPYNPSLGSNWL